jgi:hypothetical protein
MSAMYGRRPSSKNHFSPSENLRSAFWPFSILE